MSVKQLYHLPEGLSKAACHNLEKKLFWKQAPTVNGHKILLSGGLHFHRPPLHPFHRPCPVFDGNISPHGEATTAWLDISLWFVGLVCGPCWGSW